MIFSFLKYLQPTSYFVLPKLNGKSIFPKTDLLASTKTDLKKDENFDSPLAKEYELSWRAIRLGYIGEVETYDSFKDVPLVDNYRFIRKYFNKVWVFYVLLIRLLSLKNPIQEIKAYLSSRNVKRFNIKPKVFDYKNRMKQDKVENRPLVSVVIPTLNRYVFLENILRDFEGQDYSNFEIIIVDQSDDYNPVFYEKFDLNINLIRQEEKALWLARNTAIINAKGTIIALSEDDVRIESNWLSNHLECLETFNADVSAGVFYPEGKTIPLERSFYAISTQFATGNAMLYKDVFKTTGLFDRQFEKQRMGDGEFGLRVYLNDFKSISNPYAYCIDVKAESGGLREMGSWDAFRPSSLFSPRPIPSVIYFYRRYFGSKAAKLSLLRTIPVSIVPYQFKKNKPMLVMGIFISALLLPIIAFQVWRSWQLASKKIEQGPMINQL